MTFEAWSVKSSVPAVSADEPESDRVPGEQYARDARKEQ